MARAWRIEFPNALRRKKAVDAMRKLRAGFLIEPLKGLSRQFGNLHVRFLGGAWIGNPVGWQQPGNSPHPDYAF